MSNTPSPTRKRVSPALILSALCCFVGLGLAVAVGIALPFILKSYMERVTPALLPYYLPLLLWLYLAIVIAVTVMLLLLALLNVVLTGRIFTPVSGKLVFAISVLVIIEGFVFGAVGGPFKLALCVAFVAVTMGLCLMVVSGVLREAAALKEENDGTI